jgi:EpsD family peptidyl-prolyl cis-trans isomerase
MNCTKRSKARLRLVAVSATVLGLSLILFGCSKTNTAMPSQLAAKMGSDEVTLYEVERVLAHQPPAADANAAASRKRLLDQLIDQHLMADEALRQKFDRTPDAVLDVQLCKQSVLQNAYLMSVLAQRSSNVLSDRKSAQAYYDEHPLSFAQRQIYWIKEIVFPQKAGLDADAAGKLALADLLAFLEQHSIKYRVTFGQVGSDELPPELQKATDVIKDGHSIVVPLADDLVMLTRLSASPAPVKFATAEPGIVQYLARQQAEQQVRAQTASLRASANVQYMNQFASVIADSKPGPGRPRESRASVLAR